MNHPIVAHVFNASALAKAGGFLGEFQDSQGHRVSSRTDSRAAERCTEAIVPMTLVSPSMFHHWKL